MANTLRIIVAQLNFWVGDIQGNTRKIIDAIQQARDEFHGDIILFPELALSGYPPEDLLLRKDFHQQIESALQEIQQQVSGIDVVLGYPQRIKAHIYNAASVIRDGKIITTYHKQCLPNYGVFDEDRYFSPGTESIVFHCKELPISILICEDIWHSKPLAHAKQTGAELILCLNASPFNIDKSHAREHALRERVSETQLPIIYAHGVGGQDDLIFDGGSMAIDADGHICTHAGFYEEKLFPVTIQLDKPLKITTISKFKHPSTEENVYKALVLGVRDYVEKNNIPGVLVGISGGIDSSLTLAIAVDALGKDKVEAVALPSRYTSQLSLDLLAEQIKSLGVKSTMISIEPSFSAFLTSLAPEFSAEKTEENIQSRCRGILMMALSNNTGKIMLNTSNKSELATGYGTLYGDMAGGFAVLKDVSKTWVYRLAKYRNTLNPVIPERIIDRPPTAELAPNQKDEDTLPPYSILDPILEMYVEQDCSLQDIIAAGFDEKIVRQVIAMVKRNEYKRRQFTIGPRITPRAFGRERRYPITSKFNS